MGINFSQVISAFNALMTALGNLASSVLGLFGIPSQIQVGSVIIDTGGIFSAIIMVATFLTLSTMFKEYIKWIFIGIIILLVLWIVGGVVR